jgi:NADPH:quinone reductase
MKAVAIREFGGPGGLQVIDLPDPEPGAGQVLIATEAIGVGGVDTMILSGAYAERAIAGDQTLIPLPDGLSAADAVTLGSSGAVAHFALRHARFTRGESVLVRGGAGGIGLMTVQLAARQGASEVAVTTSSAERGARLRELGATQVLDRAGRGSPGGYADNIPVVAGPDLPAFLARLNQNGRMVTVGTVGGYPPADFGMGLFAAFQRSLSLSTFSADTVPWDGRRVVTGGLFAAAVRGEVTSVVHEVLPLEQAALAHEKMIAGQVFGRIVLVTG